MFKKLFQKKSKKSSSSSSSPQGGKGMSECGFGSFHLSVEIKRMEEIRKSRLEEELSKNYENIDEEIEEFRISKKYKDSQKVYIKKESESSIFSGEVSEFNESDGESDGDGETCEIEIIPMAKRGKRRTMKESGRNGNVLVVEEKEKGRRGGGGRGMIMNRKKRVGKEESNEDEEDDDEDEDEDTNTNKSESSDSDNEETEEKSDDDDDEEEEENVEKEKVEEDDDEGEGKKVEKINTPQKSLEGIVDKYFDSENYMIEEFSKKIEQGDKLNTSKKEYTDPFAQIYDDDVCINNRNSKIIKKKMNESEEEDDDNNDDEFVENDINNTPEDTSTYESVDLHENFRQNNNDDEYNAPSMENQSLSNVKVDADETVNAELIVVVKAYSVNKEDGYNEEDMLKVRKGDILELIETDDEWVYARKISGECGYVPVYCVENMNENYRQSVLKK